MTTDTIFITLILYIIIFFNIMNRKFYAAHVNFPVVKKELSRKLVVNSSSCACSVEVNSMLLSSPKWYVLSIAFWFAEVHLTMDGESLPHSVKSLEYESLLLYPFRASVY